MDRVQMFYALKLNECTAVSCGGLVVYAVPGDVVIDYLAERKVMRKLEFDTLIQDGEYDLSGDLDSGWIVCRVH